MSEARSRGGFGTWALRIFRFLLGIFLAIHVYAIALKVLPVPGTVLMVQRAAEGEGLRRSMVSINDISPNLVRAVIAAEDTRFCKHKGVDFEAIQKALDDHDRGKGLRGASTITQQAAKNVFLWNGGGFVRKAGDMWMATFIDFVWGKRRVMEAYLNVAEWGDGIFGAEAAAQARFGKSAADLTEREAALLAAVLPSPNKWRVDPPGPYVSKRAGTLQARMLVVQSEGLASCVLGNDPAPPKAPKPVPGEVKPETPAARPELPDLPPEPEEGPEALPQEAMETPTDDPDDFDAFLESAQGRFEEQAGDPPAEEAEAPQDDPTETVEGIPATEDPVDAPQEEGPMDLRPRSVDPETEDAPD